MADGKLLVDEPAEGVVRLTISNLEKRNALDHPILDAITATLQELAAPEGAPLPDGDGRRRDVLGRIRHRRDPDEEFEERAERLVAHPFTEAIDALEAFPCRRSRCCRDTRSEAGWSSR